MPEVIGREKYWKLQSVWSEVFPAAKALSAFSEGKDTQALPSSALLSLGGTGNSTREPFTWGAHDGVTSASTH